MGIAHCFDHVGYGPFIMMQSPHRFRPWKVSRDYVSCNVERGWDKMSALGPMTGVREALALRFEAQQGPEFLMAAIASLEMLSNPPSHHFRIKDACSLDT